MKVRDLRERVGAQVRAARVRWPVLDHTLDALRHYGEVLGAQLAGAVTYFGFLSFFPIIALAFAAVGYVVDYVPGAADAVTRAMQSIFPGLIGTGSGQINVEAIASKKAGVGIVGLIGLLYSGLGWVSALRTSLHGVFRSVGAAKRNLVVGKAVDLVVLAIIGLVLIVSVALGTAITGFASSLIDLAGLSDVAGIALLLRVAGVIVGVGANTVLFFVIYRLLPKQDGVAARSVWQGALIGAVGFEILKQLAGIIIGQVTSNPLYGTFAVMIALLVWISYFSRLVVLGACWAATAGPRAQESTAAVPAGSGSAGSGVAVGRGHASHGTVLKIASATVGLVGVGWLVLRRGRARPAPSPAPPRRRGSAAAASRSSSGRRRPARE